MRRRPPSCAGPDYPCMPLLCIRCHFTSCADMAAAAVACPWLRSHSIARRLFELVCLCQEQEQGTAQRVHGGRQPVRVVPFTQPAGGVPFRHAAPPDGTSRDPAPVAFHGGIVLALPDIYLDTELVPGLRFIAVKPGLSRWPAGAHGDGWTFAGQLRLVLLVSHGVDANPVKQVRVIT